MAHNLKQQVKRKSKEQKQKGVDTPDATEKKESKLPQAQGLIDPQDDATSATPAGKQRKKEDGDGKTEDQQQLATGKDLTIELLAEAPPLPDKLSEEVVKGLKDTTTEADKKCCKCSQGKCLGCQCYKGGRWCAPTCKSQTCANQEHSRSDKDVMDESTFMTKMRMAQPEDLAKEMFRLSKAVSAIDKQVIDLDYKHTIDEQGRLKKLVVDLQTTSGRLASQLEAMEKKISWLLNKAKEGDQRQAMELGAGASRRREATVEEFFGETKELQTGYDTFNMDSLGDDLPGGEGRERNKGSRAMVIKYFKQQPTAAMVRNVLKKMECEFIEPAAIKAKRVGEEFIAVVRLQTVEDLHIILRNKYLLRGTSLWVGVDKYEQDWKVRTTRNNQEQVQRERPVSSFSTRPKSMSSFPHTELWSDVYDNPKPTWGRSGNDNRRRGRGSGRGGRQRYAGGEEWREVPL